MLFRAMPLAFLVMAYRAS